MVLSPKKSSILSLTCLLVKLGECVSTEPVPIRTRTSKLELYQNYFESEYIRFTASDVSNSCAAILQHEGIVAFLRAVESRISSERQRALQYMEAGTEAKLHSACVTAIITNNEDIITSGFRTLLSEGHFEG